MRARWRFSPWVSRGTVRPSFFRADEPDFFFACAGYGTGRKHVRLSMSLVLASPQVSRSSESSYGCCVYDSNPGQIWNRLFSILFIRQYQGGTYWADELDPLLWTETRFLLSEPSHGSALHLLDEFLEAQGQNQVHDSVKKAVLEHDLWAVFDWSARRQDNYPAERRDLQIRLAEVLRRLALSKNEIASLPDNYEAAVKSGEFAQQYDPENVHWRKPRSSFEASRNGILWALSFH
jgi:hypothetical protein